MKRLAVFASGNGSNFEAVVSACADGRIDASVVLLVCDNPDAFVIARAKDLDVETFLISVSDFNDRCDYETCIAQRLIALRVDLVCLAGYMRIVGNTLLDAFPNRILNIHPSLLPEFKGAHAIDDALASGTNVYGVTVHFVDASLDGGPIILQRSFVYDGSDRDELESRIHAVEHVLYPEAIAYVINNVL